MTARSLARPAGALVLATWATLGAPTITTAIPTSSADPCADVSIVFARGTHQEPGLGNIGQGFVDSLTSDLAGRSVEVYAVNYPANDDYHFSAPSGADDVSAHVQNTIATCPKTQIVLGGYSQGATVINLASTAMPASAAGHVAAVAQFGEPSSGLSGALWGGPLPTINPIYSGKTISLCATDDPICSGGGNIIAHVTYVESGMTAQAATFAANRIK